MNSGIVFWGIIAIFFLIIFIRQMIIRKTQHVDPKAIIFAVVAIVIALIFAFFILVY